MQLEIKYIFFVLASGDRTFENVAKLSPVAWSKKNLSHSTSYFSFVARSWRMNMYEDVIGADVMPTFLKIMGQMVQVGLSTVESQPTDWVSNASAPSHLIF